MELNKNYRSFTIEYLSEPFGDIVGSAEIAIHQKVFDAVDDEWCRMFYPLYFDIDVIGHIVSNVIGHSRPLNKLDGFANLPADYVRVVQWPEFELNLDITEIT